LAASDHNSNPAKPLILCVAVVGLLTLLSLLIGLGLWRGYLVGVTVLTFLAYGYDKRQAVGGGGRVSEASLHILALIGGTLGAMAGQLVFSHKTRKQSFRNVFMGIVLFQIVLSGIWFWITG